MNNTNWHFYIRTDDTWKALKEAFLNARKTIDIEQYILEPDNVGQFVKRCDVSQIKIGNKWISSYILLKPGDYARILMLEDDHVYLISKNMNTAHMDEVDEISRIMCLRNDSGFVFLT